MKGVIITVYIESQPPLRRRWRRSDQKSDPVLKSLPKKPKSHSYDRRAQLLAYAQELRNATDSRLLYRSNKNSDPKKSKPPPDPAVNLRFSFSRIFQRTKFCRSYERVESGKKKKKIDGRRSNTNFCRKIKSMMKELSCRGEK